MSWKRLLPWFFPKSDRTQRRRAPQVRRPAPGCFRPVIELLEDRLAPASVSDLAVASFAITPDALARTDMVVTYTAEVTNHGPDAAAGVVATLWGGGLPNSSNDGVTLSATSTQGVCTVGPTAVNCAIGLLAPGQTATVTVVWMPGAQSSGQIIHPFAYVNGNVQEPDLPPLSAADFENLVADGVFDPDEQELIDQLVASNNYGFLEYLVPARLVVDTTNDTIDSNDGLMSLREAILAANSNGGFPTIIFNLPGDGVQSIHLNSPLPVITQSVFIDGFTQPGARPDGPAPGNDAIILVELDGSAAGPANGLHLVAGSSTLRGLAINRFEGNGILLETGGGNIVQQNFIGTDGAGKQDWGNQGDGIRVVASSDNIIGGPVATDANVIGFNGGAGVALFQEPPPPPPPPIAPLPPGYAGTGYAEGDIAFDFSAPDQYGVQRSLYEFYGRLVVVDLCAIHCGPCRFFTEIIPGLQSELDAAGLEIAYLQVLVRELDLTPCTQAEAVQWAADFGLSIPVLQGEQARAIIASWFAHEAPEDRAYPTLLFLSPQLEILDVQIGALPHEEMIEKLSGLADRLGLHPGPLPVTPVGNQILGNAIAANGGLGIDLSIDGVTANDTLDTDSGPNNLQNFPELITAFSTGETLTIQYAVPSAATNSSYPLRVEYFRADADGQEGRTFLGSDTYSQAGAKTVGFVPTSPMAFGDRIVATATDMLNNTSEFSQSIALPAFGSIANQNVNEDPGVQSVSLTNVMPGPAAATGEPGQPLILTAVSSNPTLIPNPTITTSGSTRTLTYQPNANKNGTATITVTANNSFTRTFTVSVLAVNDPPAFEFIANRTVNEDPGEQLVPIAGVMPGPISATDETGQSVTFTAVSSNPKLIPNPTIMTSGSTRTLKYTPVANANGTATITVTARDDQSTNNTFVRTFTVTVNPVNDADLAISMTESTSPAGRERNLTYTITVLNNGPDTADKATVTAAIPSGAIFISSSLTPFSNDGKKVTWTLGSIPAGVKASLTMTVFVPKTAPDTLVCLAQVTTIAQEPSLANNSITRSTSVVNVGAFVVTAPASVDEGDRFPVTLDWTVPGGRWRELNTVDLRVLDEQGTVLWIRFDEAANTISLFNSHSGKFGPAFTPGSANVLTNEWATLYLEGCSVRAAGPSAPTVTLTLDVSFQRRAADRNYWVEVAATDDLGNVQAFEIAAVLQLEVNSMNDHSANTPRIAAKRRASS